MYCTQILLPCIITLMLCALRANLSGVHEGRGTEVPADGNVDCHLFPNNSVLRLYVGGITVVGYLSKSTCAHCPLLSGLNGKKYSLKWIDLSFNFSNSSWLCCKRSHMHA